VRLTEGQRAARVKGGQATYERHGREHFVRMGKAGGRPRAHTLAEIRAERG